MSTLMVEEEAIRESETKKVETGVSYQPATWEKICTISLGGVALLLVGFLLLRGVDVSRSMLSLTHIVASLAVSAVGIGLPGYLDVGFSTRGLAIRGGGALALFLVTFFGLRSTLPAETLKIQIEIRDSSTTDLIYRTPLSILYDSDGEHRRWNCDPDHRGRVHLPAESKNIKVESVVSPGYRYEKTTDADGKKIVWLERTGRFESAIRESVSDESVRQDVESRGFFVSDYEAMLKEERESGVNPMNVRIAIRNNTEADVDVFLRRYAPSEISGPAYDNFLKWIPVQVSRQGYAEHSNFGTEPGGYFCIYASTHGRDVELIAQGALYLTEKTELVIDWSEDADERKLVGELVRIADQ